MDSSEDTLNIVCPICKAHFKRSKSRQMKKPLFYCAYCGARIEKLSPADFSVLQLHGTVEPPPDPNQIISKLGNYLILKSIGKGGMGEVFLAYDQISGRRVALKKIRPEYVDSPRLRGRFLREARITSQLTHPSIIPIYSIHDDGSSLYYTMPFVEGKTLRQILDTAKKLEETEGARHSDTSIPTLMRIFSNVVQAVAYAHAKGVLHRDIKPENIMVGEYGQVIILDWGLTKILEETEEESLEDLPEAYTRRSKMLTKLGKIVGTIAYMAPERAKKMPATIQTDIYALGIILYQILTLTMPFQRKNLEDFQAKSPHELLTLPEVRAPYRDVPPHLSEIIKQCLAANPIDRYKTCDELLKHVESYLEGRSEWFFSKRLSVACKEDWEFQEHVLIAEHPAITRGAETADWVSLMVSKDSFAENIRIECTVQLGTTSQGIGLLVSIPEAIDRIHLTEGFFLWLASKKSSSKTRLTRSSVTVVEDDEFILESSKPYKIRLETVSNHLSVYINDRIIMQYTSYTPLLGTHVGVLSKDGDFTFENGLNIFIGSENLSVSCLSVPDAFLASRDFDRALSEYRRIGTVFTGHAEGREALFRAGVALLEQAKESQNKQTLLDLSSTEFEKLRNTPGAPLEYLGKALIYESETDFIEEAKCLELALRRYPKHPLLPIFAEQIILRMHETTRVNRKAAYYFILLAARYLPKLSRTSWSLSVFESLKKHWEEPPFFCSKDLDKEDERHAFCIKLAFWLQRPHTIQEIISDLVRLPVLPVSLIFDALYLLRLMNEEHLFSKALTEVRSHFSDHEREKHKECFSLIALTDIPTVTESTPRLEQILYLLLQHKPVTQTFPLGISEPFAAFLAAKWIEQNQFDKVREIFSQFDKTRCMNENSPLFFPYGCLIAHEQGIDAAKAHFSTLFDTAFPRSYLLGAHFINGTLSLRSNWLNQSFWCEKDELVRQLKLFDASSKTSSYYQRFKDLCKNS